MHINILCIIRYYNTNWSISTKITKPNKTNRPILFIAFTIVRLTGFFLIHSIKTNIIWNPSSAGIGRRLNTAKFTAISGNNSKRYEKLVWVYDAIILIVVTGPPSDVIDNWPVKSWPRIIKIFQAHLQVNGIASFKLSKNVYL